VQQPVAVQQVLLQPAVPAPTVAGLPPSILGGLGTLAAAPAQTVVLQLPPQQSFAAPQLIQLLQAPAPQQPLLQPLQVQPPVLAVQQQPLLTPQLHASLPPPVEVAGARSDLASAASVGEEGQAPPPAAEASKEEPKRCHLHTKPNRWCKACQRSASTSGPPRTETKAAGGQAAPESGVKELEPSRGNFLVSPMLRDQLLKSSYFKGLLSITSVDGLAEEIQTSGDSLEVYEKGTSMATPSAFFCAVFRLHNLDHTEEELQMLLDHPDYVIARCVGFLFARFTMKADRLWDALEEYMLDEMSLGAFRDGSMPSTIGEYIEHLLLKEKYCGTPLPRLPVTARRRLEEHIAPLAQHRKRAAANRRELEIFRKPGTTVEIVEDGEWLTGSVLELNDSVPSRLKVTVQLQEGNITTVHLGKAILKEEGSEDQRTRRRGASPDWSRCKGKSESVLLQELRGHAKEEAVCGSGKDYAKRPQAFEVGLAKRREQGSAESQMQQEDTTHARQKRRSDKDADADRESKMLRRSTDEEKERQRYSKQIFEKYGQVRSRPSTGTAQDDDVDRIQLG